MFRHVRAEGVIRRRAVGGTTVPKHWTRSRSVIGVVGLIASLTMAAAGREFIEWDAAADAALRDEVTRLAGRTAIDCGFVDLRKRPASAYAKRTSLECIANAQSRGVPFKFGIVRQPLGRDAWEVYARAESGEYWLVSHGRHASEDAAKSWAMRCAFIEVSERTLMISGMDCGQPRLLGEATQ